MIFDFSLEDKQWFQPEIIFFQVIPLAVFLSD
jgi:hypothetical protein